MMLLFFGLEIVFQAAPQPVEDFRGHIRDLGSDNVSVRDKALASLKSLPYSRTDELRKIAESETDIEKRERLNEVVRSLLGMHAETLFKEGKLEESLLKSAESEGARDPQAEAEHRISLARAFILECFDGNDAPGSKIIYPPKQMKELREKHGRYALPALLEFMKGGHSNDAFHFIKLALGADVIPFLCGFLKQKDCPMPYEVCTLLGSMGGGDLTITTLKSVMDDPNRNTVTRNDAKKALIELKALEPDK